MAPEGHSDILMKYKIAKEIKIGPYAEDWRSGTPMAPDNVKASRYGRWHVYSMHSMPDHATCA